MKFRQSERSLRLGAAFRKARMKAKGDEVSRNVLSVPSELRSVSKPL
jgi:hypothetical protein